MLSQEIVPDDDVEMSLDPQIEEAVRVKFDHMVNELAVGIHEQMG